eukprot:TRINITY_DN4205_c0_g2_i2.p1 TRINITY_DN4205_c0_g2~~TRINITY_DN4205_c0_g2_i2.p1  ORF type:complete len:704 (-),score=145.57 TRINITY_DN4205_c0_g2_i2:1013-3124(-)
MSGTNSAGEELLVKTRKPYTITKQRERWTEEEHDKFLEALKLYGRAWQRIEEHIGTKTAVQIRSHAQKFFTKLEKESLTKGVPPGHAHDIDIPPPRPKRKPSNPYPRKTSVGSIPSSPPGARDVKPVTSISSLCPSRQALDLENDPPPEDHPGIETCQRTKETPKDGNCSEVLNNFQEAPSAFISPTRITSVSIPKVLTKQCASSECVPPLKEINGPTTTDGSYLTAESKSNQKLGKADISSTDLNISRREGPNLEDCSHPTHEKVVPEERTNELKQREKLDALSIETQSINCPTHEFVNVAHTSSFDRTSPVSVSHHSGDQENPNPFPIPPISPTTEQYVNSGRPSFYPSFPIPHPPFTLFRNNHDSYQSFLNVSTFSGLIISTLLQNPAVHAAATVAASFWPYADNSSTDTLVGGCPVRQTGQSPSLTAIVAATVAAASAWWASHGLLPFYPPPHTSFAFPPTATTDIPTEGTIQVTEDNKEITDGMPSYPAREDQRLLDREFSTALRAQAPATKLPSPDTDENGGESAHAAQQKASSLGQMTVPCPAMPDTDEGKTGKPLDRSSCGSNTTSSSEVETDALEKHAEGNEDSKEAGDEPINRRCKNIGSNSDSWKEVSEEVVVQQINLRLCLNASLFLFTLKFAVVWMVNCSDALEGQEPKMKSNLFWVLFKCLSMPVHHQQQLLSFIKSVRWIAIPHQKDL